MQATIVRVRMIFHSNFSAASRAVAAALRATLLAVRGRGRSSPVESLHRKSLKKRGSNGNDSTNDGGTIKDILKR